MGDYNSFGNNTETPVEGNPHPQGPLAAGYKFSPDELRVLQECNQESFFQRSLPLGTALGLGTLAAVQRGYFKPNPRFGAFPKVTLAVIVGYFMGKISYQQRCAEKLMALPGSYLGQLLRDKRDGKISGSSLTNRPSSLFGAEPADIYSDAGPGSSLNLDTDRPLFSDDLFRPDSDGGKPLQDTPAQPSLSYEELRRRNRGQYNESRQDPYKVDPSAMPPIGRPRPTPPPGRHTNKYGDEME